MNSLIKNTGIMEQIIEPTYFNEYPVDWAKTAIYRFDQLDNDPDSQLNYNFTTYSTPFPDGEEPQSVLDFAKKMTVFSIMWRR